MPKRLYVQFGVLLVAGAFVTSTAYADASDNVSSGSTDTQSQNSNVDVTTGGSAEVTISTSTSSSQSVGGSSPTSNNSDSTPPQNGAPSGATLETQTIPDSSALSAPANPSSESSTIASSPSSLSSSEQLPATAIRPLANSGVSLAIKEAVFERQLANHKAALEAPATAVVPQPATPSVPQTPADILSQLRNLLTASTLTALQGTSGYESNLLGALTSPNAQLALTVLIALVASLLLIDFYTARLRRSGYSGAARSDVGDGRIPFVTPPKMGFIGSFAT